MVSAQMTQKDIVDEIKNRTGYNKKDLRVVFKTLDQIIIESMNMATYDEPSEIILFSGWRLGAKRMPERPYCDPRNREEIITPEKLIPHCKFKQSFRQRINKWEPEDEYEDDEEEDFSDDD